jgi:DNA methylase
VTLPVPFYADPMVTLYCADARDVLPDIAARPESTVVITDPVWPNAPVGAFGVTDPAGLFLEAASHFPRLARRVVVHLGCMSDPRFLVGVPAELPYVRTCWLRYACPSYHGTILNGGDVAYVFGSAEGPEGKTVLPGETTSTSSRGKEADHPMPRKIEHLRWLVGMLTRQADTVIDPFAGGGTTLLAAKNAGRRAVGIEKSPTYCLEVVNRLRQECLPMQEACR